MGAGPEATASVEYSTKGVLKLKIGTKDPISFERWDDNLRAAIGDNAARVLDKPPPPVEKWASQVGFQKGDDAALAAAYQTARTNWDATSRNVANLMTRCLDFSEDTLGTYASDLRALKSAKAKLA